MKGLIIAAVVVGGTLIALFIWSEMNELSTKKKGVPASESWTSNDDKKKLDNFKVEIKDDKVGAGREAKKGDTLLVHYTGTLKNGTKFDSSRDPGREPYEVILGFSNVIQGWHRGLVGMKVGGVRTLVIPPELAYGDKQNGSIPPNSELTFKVELLQIK